MSESVSSSDMSRRAFLRGMTGIGAGVVAGGVLLPPTMDCLEEATTDITGIPAGNAAYNQRSADACATSEVLADCRERWEPVTSEKVSAIVGAPIFEEVVCRAAPSLLIDRLRPNGVDSPSQVLWRGTTEKRFTRAEIIGGVASSVVFGLTHNITPRGISTEFLPVGQTVGGGVLWALARKFGLGSSIACHAAFNFRFVNR